MPPAKPSIPSIWKKLFWNLTIQNLEILLQLFLRFIPIQKSTSEYQRFGVCEQVVAQNVKLKLFVKGLRLQP